MGEDMKMTDFPTYPWETLDVYQDNSYCYNIRPGQHGRKGNCNGVFTSECQIVDRGWPALAGPYAQ